MAAFPLQKRNYYKTRRAATIIIIEERANESASRVLNLKSVSLKRSALNGILINP